MLEFLKRCFAPVAAKAATSVLSAELRDSIDAARFSVREPTEEGPRVVVMSGALLGMFVYSREEAERRILKAFPELDEQAVARGVRHLESRVALVLRPIVQASRARKSWVHGWRSNDEIGEGFR